MEPKLVFVTPAWRRFALTRACLAQRRALCDALPFEADCVVIGDDGNLEAAREFGFPVVEHDNRWVSAKFRAGYQHAIRALGATHVMPIGSDSFLHPRVFENANWRPRWAIGLIGLTSMAPWGDERLDLNIKYPAGFGVGMVYPEHAIRTGDWGPDPHKNSGIDTSTWARCGRGKVQIEFQEVLAQGYVNFHSPDTQITSYESLKGTHVRRYKTRGYDCWRALDELYGTEYTDPVKLAYALNALGVFLTGKRPELERARGLHPQRLPKTDQWGRDIRFDGYRA